MVSVVSLQTSRQQEENNMDETKQAGINALVARNNPGTRDARHRTNHVSNYISFSITFTYDSDRFSYDLSNINFYQTQRYNIGLKLKEIYFKK